MDWKTLCLGASLALPSAVRAEAPHAEHAEHAEPREQTVAREGNLAEAADLATLEQLTLARHPALEQARTRSHAASYESRERSGLPAPELVYQQWAVPLARPYDLTRANMVMVGARVPIPSRAVRHAEARAGRARAESTEAYERVTELDLLTDVRLTYAEYVRAHQELALHHEHEALVDDLYELARAAYASNQTSASALHETRVALAKLHSDIAMIDAELARTRVRLNLLAGRAADAPLGPPHEAHVEAAADPHATRPELTARARAIESVRHEAEAKKLAASRPEWVVGVDYMAMPMDGRPWGYGAMVSMSLPWLSGSLDAQARRAEVEVREQRAALATETLEAAMQVEEARIELAAAERTRALVRDEWLVHAREAYEVERGAWASGRSDARTVLERLDALLEARIALVRAERDVLVRSVSLARALGSGTGAVGQGGTP